jgi:uncharacterized membrane protein YphA (DoxX/SURF4 family)
MAEAASMPVSGFQLNRRYVQIALLVGRIVVGAIFLYAGYEKLHYAGAWHPRDYHFLFAFGVNSYQMLSLENSILLARILPPLEIVLGVLLIAGIGLRWAGPLTAALLIVFMIALIHALLMGTEIKCGCFGNSSASPGRELLLDAFLLPVTVAVTAAAFVSRRNRNARNQAY